MVAILFYFRREGVGKKEKGKKRKVLHPEFSRSRV
jgi:hypothetical protein